MCIIHWRSEHKSVSFFSFCHKFIDLVISEHTAFFAALAASDAIPDGAAPQLKNFLVNAFFFQRFSHFFQRKEGISLLVGTSVYH